MDKISFLAQLWKINRDHENETKITFCCDSQQLGIINSIPAQELLQITISIKKQKPETETCFTEFTEFPEMPASLDG